MPNEPEIVIAATQEQRDDAFAVRLAVFVDEQRIPREEELDEQDATAIHCVGYDGQTPIAAGRLVLMNGLGKIGRMAVLAPYRGRGVGALVLAALEQEAVDRGLLSLRLSAQLTARGFYDRLGYTAVGDVYDEVDIPHIAMEKSLAGG